MPKAGLTWNSVSLFEQLVDLDAGFGFFRRHLVFSLTL